MERVFFPSFDGQEISILLERPVISGAAPCVVFIHGGAWRFGQADRYVKHLTYIAGRGATAVSIEYRLLDDKHPVETLIGDCAAAIKYLRGNAGALGILPDKIAVCGESAGGHLALCLGCGEIVADGEARPDFIVNFNGATDLTGRLNWNLFGACDMSSISAEEWMKKYRAGMKVSPLYHVDGEFPPVLHMQGMADDIIFLHETMHLHDRLTELGVDSRMILLPGMPHSFILFDYQLPEAVVQRHLDQVGDILYERGFLTN